MKYYVMFDRMLVAIGVLNMYFINPDKPLETKVGLISANKSQHDMVLQHGREVIKEKFENAFDTSTPENCMNKMYYLLERDKK